MFSGARSVQKPLSFLMLRSLLCALLALVVLPQPALHAQDAPSPVVEGTLVGHDGTALPVSHLHVLPYDNDRTRSHPVGSDPSFRAPLDTTGVVTLRFTGQNHEMQDATVLARPGDTIGVDVRLGTFSRPDSLDLKVFGTFNDFSYQSGTLPMEERDDGTFAAVVPTPDDSLTYGVLGTEPDGTQLDRLEYAGDGDYRAVLATPKDSTTITYDPSAVPRGDTDPTVEFRDPASTAARYAAFVDNAEALHEAYVDEMRAADDREERKALSDTFDWSPNHERLDRALQSDPPTQIANAYRAAYLDHTFSPDSTVAKEALNTIPAASPLWGLAGLNGTIRAGGGMEAHEPFAYEVLRKHPSDEVKSRTLFALLVQADENDKAEKQKLIYSWMEGEYPDASIMRLVRERYAPNRAIQPGKPVPEFEVAALRDTTKTFTTSSFEGQYVLLDFWATWCGPCIEELPTLRKADSTYGDDGFAILSLSLDDARSTVTNFLQDREMPWKHAFLDQGFESKTADRFEVVGIPKPVLVGPEGQIVATSADVRGEKLLKTLEKHLGSASDASASN